MSFIIPAPRLSERNQRGRRLGDLLFRIVTEGDESSTAAPGVGASSAGVDIISGLYFIYFLDRNRAMNVCENIDTTVGKTEARG